MDLPDFPPKVDIATEIYQPLPELTVDVDWDILDASTTAEQVLTAFSTALDADNNAFSELFLPQSYWRDTLALTSHLRTFKDCERITNVFKKVNKEHRIHGIAIVPGSAQIVVESETLVS